MDFQLNVNVGTWLKQLNGKTVDKVYQVDFNENRHEDIYSPWLFFITFLHFDYFLAIEGDIDGNHIKIDLYDNSKLEDQLAAQHFPDETTLWQVYDTQQDETLGLLLEQKINFIEYGVDKDELEINGIITRGEKSFFTFIRLHCDIIQLTIFESLGLATSSDKNVQLNFEETFDTYDTK